MFIFSFGNVLGQLTAGDFDDNLNYGYFLDYINKSHQNDQSNILPQLNLRDRITIRVTDKHDVGVSNAIVSITPYGEQELIIESNTGTNGIFYFFPHIDGTGNYEKINLKISSPDVESIYYSTIINMANLPSDRTIEVKLDDYESVLPNSLDLMFVIDTTGSISDELNYLTSEFKNIISQIENKYPQVAINFGLVVYRDIGDTYVVRSYDFTDSLSKMQEQLNAQRANGGGDYPEAMDQALGSALNFQWHAGNTARMLFLVADAPPHNEKLQATLDNVILARKQGIHIFPIAASGVADTAEYMMRTAACLTNGRYIFLTDDSGIGNPHAEPHIPGYIVTHLDTLFVRVVGSELMGKRIEAEDNEIIRRVGSLDNGVVYPVKEWTEDPEDYEDKVYNTNLTEDNVNSTNSTGSEDSKDAMDDDYPPDDELYVDTDSEIKTKKSHSPSLSDDIGLLCADSYDLDYFDKPCSYPEEGGEGKESEEDMAYNTISNIPLFLLIIAVPFVIICILIIGFLTMRKRNIKRVEKDEISKAHQIINDKKNRI